MGTCQAGDVQTAARRGCTPTSATLTADASITTDMEHVFVHMASQSKLPRLSKLWMAPFHLHRNTIAKIERAGPCCSGRERRPHRGEDELADGRGAGPKPDRCRSAGRTEIRRHRAGGLRSPGAECRATPATTSRVRSVVGRLLEHSRVFYFRIDGVDELYLSSADWMNRNMVRRVEVAWPVSG